MTGCTRRGFLRAAGGGALSAGAAWVLSASRVLSLFGEEPGKGLHEASDWEAKPNGQIQCHVCPFD